MIKVNRKKLWELIRKCGKDFWYCHPVGYTGKRWFARAYPRKQDPSYWNGTGLQVFGNSPYEAVKRLHKLLNTQ